MPTNRLTPEDVEQHFEDVGDVPGLDPWQGAARFIRTFADPAVLHPCAIHLKQMRERTEKGGPYAP